MPSRSPLIPVRATRRRGRLRALAAAALVVIGQVCAPAPAADGGSASPVVEVSYHESTGVLSAWLANGVRLHHRRVERAGDRVYVFVTLFGGVIEEGPGKRGLTEAMAAGIRATRPEPAEDGGDKRAITLGAVVAGPDMVRVTLGVDKALLDDGLELLRLGLTRPRVDEEVVDRWRSERARAAESAVKDPRAALGEAIMRALYGPVGAGPLDADDIAGVQAEAAERWAADMLAGAPIEAVVVSGDGPEVMERVAEVLAGLADRERLEYPALVGPAREVLPEEPVLIEVPFPEPGEGAIAQGFLASDLSDLTKSRRMILAARLVEARVKSAGNDAPPSHVSAHLIPADAFPGRGLFVVTATARAGAEGATADRVLALLRGFAEDGPTGDELENAKKDIRRTLESSRAAPGYWLDRLSQVTARGYGPDDLSGAIEEYTSFTAEEIRETFAWYMESRAAFRVLVRGRAGGEADPMPGEER